MLKNIELFVRLVSFSKPATIRVLPYVLFTFLTVVFSLLNFTLLIPLLDILFKNNTTAELSSLLVKPEFALNTDYLLALFNYHFAQIIIEYGKISALQFIVVTVIISVLLSNIFRYLSQVQIEALRAQTVINFRQTIFNKMLNLDLKYFSNERKGDLIQRIMNDVNEVDSSITSTLSVFFKEPLTLIVLFFALFKISVSLTLFTLITIPISGGIISFFTKRLRRDSDEVLHVGGQLLSALDESIFGIKVVQAFNGHGFIGKMFSTISSKYTNLNKRIALRKEMASPFSEFSGVLVVSFILLYGGTLVLQHDSALSASSFVAYIILFSQVLRPSKTLSTSITGMQRGFSAWKRIKFILDINPEVQSGAQAKTVSAFQSDITFNNVSFSYGHKTVLKNINFTLQKGKMVALVGPSGGGKSTLADLIIRFHDPITGNITLDGLDLKEISLFSLRSLIGMVSQESFLFNDTIYNNIVFGLENVSPEQVEHAAKVANAHEFILKTEHGYQTSIGDRGIKLSGGQKQRINIARAVLRNPPILILDEATSALDTQSEKLVQEALDNLMKNRTTIVIAHRLSTIQHADEILVIKEGEIVERGTHQMLMNNSNGLYTKLKNLQN